MRKNRAQRGARTQEIALRNLGTQFAGPKLLRGKVDQNSLTGLPVRRDLQHCRATKAAVCEEQLLLKAAGPGTGDHFRRNSRQIGIAVEVVSRKSKRHQCRPAWL